MIYILLLVVGDLSSLVPETGLHAKIGIVGPV